MDHFVVVAVVENPLEQAAVAEEVSYHTFQLEKS
jgi:hypothetical protein